MRIRRVVLLLLVIVTGPRSVLADDPSIDADDVPSDTDDGLSDTDDGSADTDDEPLYETVVTATRLDTPRMDTTVPTDSVNARELQEREPLTVGEAVRDVPGVSLNAPAGLLYTNPSIRGLGGRRVLMLRNGRRVDSGKPIGVSGYFLALQGIDRIEVVRGPGSVHYGSDALGGVINVISPGPLTPAGPGASYRLHKGTNNNSLAQTIAAGYAGEHAGARFFFQPSVAGSYTTGDGSVVEGTQYEDDAFGVDLAWKPAPRHELSLSTGAYLGSDIGRAVNDLDREKYRVIYFPHDNNVVNDLAWQVDPAHAIVAQVHVQVYYDYVDRHLRRLLHTPEYTRVTSRMDQRSDFHTVGMIPTMTLALGDHNDMLIGLDGRFRQMHMAQEVQPYLPGGLTPPSTRSEPFDNARQMDMGVFVTDTHRFNERVQMNGGLRVDSIFQWYPTDSETGESDEAALAGSLGVLFRPIPSLALTFNGGRAFRAPTLEEKFVEFAFCKGVVCGSPDVGPEHSWNIDLGLKGFHRAFEFEAYFFNIFIGDFITLVDGDEHCDYRYTNLSRAWFIGGETRLALDFDSLLGALGVRLSVTAAYVRGQHLDTGDPLAQIPPFELDGGIRFYGTHAPVIKRFYLETTAHYSAPQNRISPSGSISSQAEQKTGAYGTLNLAGGLTIQREQRAAFNIFAKATNLTNIYYRDHLSTVPAMGLNVQMGFGIRY